MTAELRASWETPDMALPMLEPVGISTTGYHITQHTEKSENGSDACARFGR